MIGSRPRSMILARDPARGQLAGIAAAAVFVACVALAVALAAADSTARWRETLARALTVEIAPGPDAVAQAARAADLLRAVPGVAAAEVLAAERIGALLAPWLGPEARLEDLPLPVLLDLRLAPGGTFDADAARDMLALVAPDARIDDHRAWRDAIARLAWLAVGLASAVALAAIAAAALGIAMATRARLAALRTDIETLHLMGADDRAVAGEFAGAAMRSTATGGTLGTLAALALVAAARHATIAGVIEPGALPLPAFTAMHWTMLILPLPGCTLLVGLIAVWIARAALRSLP
jgi:cell division transport system permease protein